MAFVPLRLPRIQQGRQIVDSQGYPATDFVTRLNDTFSAIEVAFNGITDALNAADIATQAAAAANTAAIAANTAADAAQGSADAATRDQALINSYISPDSVVTSSPTTVTIAAHTRFYADGTSVSVSGGSAPATAAADVDYVFYLDPTRAGGAVTYQVTTTPPVQTGDTHVVGAVTVPAAGSSAGGSGPARPGQVLP